MAQSRSGLSQSRLDDVLRRIRDIASFPDDLARDALDELLASLIGGAASDGVDAETAPRRVGIDPEVWRRNLIDEAMERIRNSITRLRAGSAIGGQQMLWGGRGLLNEVDHLGNYVHSTLQAQYKEVASVKLRTI